MVCFCLSLTFDERKVGEDDQDHANSRVVSWLFSPRFRIVVSLFSRRMLDRRPFTNGSDMGLDDIRHIGSRRRRRGSIDFEVAGKSLGYCFAQDHSATPWS